MKKYYYIMLIVLIFLFSGSVLSQVSQQWIKFYSYDSLGDGATKVGLDAAGNIYITGISNDSFTHYDYLTIKYNPNGVQQWVQRYNGYGSGNDRATYLAVDAAGNVYVSGRSEGNGTELDYATIKYNTNGVQQWVRRYNGTGNGHDIVSGIGYDNLGNVFVTGYSLEPILGHSDSGYVFVTIKYNAIGNQVWLRKFNVPPSSLNPGNDYAYALAMDKSGNIYVTGKSMNEGGHPHGFLQYCITIKYNTLGDSVWVARYFDPDTLSLSQIIPTAITVNNSGYVFVTGTCSFVNSANINGFDYFTLKYNSSGVYQWFKRYNGTGSTGNNNDQPTSIVTDLNNVYITGMSKGSTSGWDYATIKYDFSGTQQWVRRYNGTGNGDDKPASIIIDSIGGTYITGSSEGSGTMGDFFTIKYDYFGNQKWSVRYNGYLNLPDGGTSLAINSSGNVYVTGQSDGILTTINYAQSIGIRNISTEVPQTFSLSQNYPNPFNPTTIIKFQIKDSRFVTLKIFDMLGKEIEALVNEKLQPGTYEIGWNASKYTSGVYFYKITAGDFTDTKRMVLIK